MTKHGMVGPSDDERRGKADSDGKRQEEAVSEGKKAR